MAVGVALSSMNAPQPPPPPAPQMQPQAAPQPQQQWPTTPGAGAQGVVVQQGQPMQQPPPNGYPPPPPQYPPPPYAQPPQPVASPYAGQPQPAAPQPQVAPAHDQATLRLVGSIRAVLRPGESITHFTKVPLTRKFWQMAERGGEAVRGYLIGLEWHLEDGVRVLYFHLKVMFASQASFETGATTIANPGEIVLVPVTAEIAPLARMLKDANTHVPDVIFYGTGVRGGVEVYVLNAMVPRSTVDAR